MVRTPESRGEIDYGKKSTREVRSHHKAHDASLPKESTALRRKLDEAAIKPLKENHPAAAANRKSKEKSEREIEEVLSPEAGSSKEKDKMLSIAAGKA